MKHHNHSVTVCETGLTNTKSWLQCTPAMSKKTGLMIGKEGIFLLGTVCTNTLSAHFLSPGFPALPKTELSPQPIWPWNKKHASRLRLLFTGRKDEIIFLDYLRQSPIPWTGQATLGHINLPRDAGWDYNQLLCSPPGFPESELANPTPVPPISRRLYSYYLSPHSGLHCRITVSWQLFYWAVHSLNSKLCRKEEGHTPPTPEPSPTADWQSQPESWASATIYLPGIPV